MGIIITKFRKKKTTYEILEKLENEIQSIEEFRRSTEQTQKKMVGRFIFISVCVYCITALIFYFYFFPSSAYERIIYIIPLIILPMLLILIKRIMSWYYNRKIRKNQKKLLSLKDEKKKILEEVMDKETYKVAQTILEKFAPEQIKKTISVAESTPIKSGPLAALNSNVQRQPGLRYRGQFTPSVMTGPSATPRPLPTSTPSLFSKPSSQSVVPTPRPPVSGTPLVLPRSILPRERSVLDKMVDYLIGDGPSNRYALICKNCFSHNGMALKEEFDYLSFRCCYCSTFNPARKKRPVAPKLNTTLLSIKNKKSDVSDSDKHSLSDTDSESDTNEPIITEPQSDTLKDEHEMTKKLSDFDIKNSDTESMEVEPILQSTEEEKPSVEETSESVMSEETEKQEEKQD